MLCGVPIQGWGHNAHPLAHGRCCDDCNHDVITARILALKELHAKGVIRLSKPPTFSLTSSRAWEGPLRPRFKQDGTSSDTTTTGTFSLASTTRLSALS